MAIEHKTMKTKALVGWAENPRKISKRGLAGLQASVQQFGCVEPPIWNKRTKRLVGGHQRVKVLRQLMVKETDVVVVDLSPEEERVLNVALNNPAITGEYTTDITHVLDEISKTRADLFGALRLGEILTPNDMPVQSGLIETESKEVVEKTSPAPDIIFPSSNEFGIPDLDISLQAEHIERPVVKWGTVARGQAGAGLIHFYTDDYKFKAIWDGPEKLVRSAPGTVVEVNYSLQTAFPKAFALWCVYQKRWLSRYWQDYGVRVFVDLNVSQDHRKENLIGVPQGWRSYATRAHESDPDGVEADYGVALTHAGSDDILFLVVGGGRRVVDLSKKHGWINVPASVK